MSVEAIEPQILVVVAARVDGRFTVQWVAPDLAAGGEIKVVIATLLRDAANHLSPE